MAMLILGARVAWLRLHAQPVATPVPTLITPPSMSPALDPNMRNVLSHTSEGENVLYVDGHEGPTTMPYAGVDRGTNSNTWNDNIFVVSTGPQVAPPATAPATSPADDILMPPTSPQR